MPGDRIARVRVVVVDHDGGEHTLACLRALLATEWPAADLDLVLVDNGSTRPVTGTVRAGMPGVRTVESPVNLGFGGGCNLGMGDLGDVDAVALINDDATVDPHWLAPLAHALEADPSCGAAQPRILLAPTFREVTLRSEAHAPGRGDRRPVGVRVAGARVGEVDVWRSLRTPRGTWGPEPRPGGRSAWWTDGDATLLVPVPDPAATTVELLVDAPDGRAVTARSGDATAVVVAGPDPAWLRVPLAGPDLRVVHSTGVEVTEDGFGVDRGWLEPDDGRFDAPGEVFAWCGGAVLLRARYLEEVGRFDESFFLYYEDLDLAWRGRAQGWRYAYVPTSIVHHVHAASDGLGWADKERRKERNRITVLRRHAGLGAAARAWARSTGATAGYLRRDAIAPALHGERPRLEYVRARARALLGAARTLPFG
ncbi:MAG: glycosyltransferase family 2 protein [Actinomycetes bacterium]